MSTNLQNAKVALVQFRRPPESINDLPTFIRRLPAGRTATESGVQRHLRVLERGHISGVGVSHMLAQSKFLPTDAYAQERINAKGVLVTFSFARVRKLEATRAAELDSAGLTIMNNFLGKLWENAIVDFVADERGILEAFNSSSAAVSIRFLGEIQSEKETVIITDAEADAWGIEVKKTKKKF